MIKDRPCFSLPGLPMALAIIVSSVAAIVATVMLEEPVVTGLCLPYVFLALFLLTGLKIVNPNEAKVLQLFGNYSGTLRGDGLQWVSPLLTSRSVSQRVRNFDSTRLKVNDRDGNPIEIGAIVVWRVADCAEACFNVDYYERYVSVQTESALRSLATHYPYDSHHADEVSLRSHIDTVAAKLQVEIQSRLDRAGVEVIESRISHLAYAPEIAQAMLQRQQAAAIIAARALIVEGAVGMVEAALKRLAADNVVQLDENRKASMVANLLVVLCGERAAQPVVDTRS